MELGRPLDFNTELQTVGVSNLVSGMLGGFTGSYIFTPTLLVMRVDSERRMIPIVVAVLSATVFLVPVSVVSVFPKFFFGAILTFIGVDLMVAWLWAARTLVRPVEHLIVLASFVAINALNLEYGMLIGIAISTVVFMIQYAWTRTARPVVKRSNVQRGFFQRQLLQKKRPSIVTMELTGYLFFGSAVQVLQAVKQVRSFDERKGSARHHPC